LQFTAFLIPEDVQHELKSAGADRISVGWPIPPDQFRDLLNMVKIPGDPVVEDYKKELGF
jgi:hypothetical protein